MTRVKIGICMHVRTMNVVNSMHLLVACLFWIIFEVSISQYEICALQRYGKSVVLDLGLIASDEKLERNIVWTSSKSNLNYSSSKLLQNRARSKT